VHGTNSNGFAEHAPAGHRYRCLSDLVGGGRQESAGLAGIYDRQGSIVRRVR